MIRDRKPEEFDFLKGRVGGKYREQLRGGWDGYAGGEVEN